MNGAIREELRRRIDEQTRAALEPSSVRRRRGDGTICSRGLHPVEPHELSPGRAWCRRCENLRQREHYHRAKATEAA